MNTRMQRRPYAAVLRSKTKVALVACACAALAACSAGDDTKAKAPQASTEEASDCRVSAKGVPTCGALWGVATRPPTEAGVKALETKMGRPFDFVYRYHDLNDAIPDMSERAQVAQGKMLHVAIAARDFSQSDRSQISWADVAKGKFDVDLSKQASGIASLKVPVFVTFEQEASQQRKVDTLGTPAEFVAAWRHVHDVYTKAGVKNAVWVWVMTGAENNLNNAAQMWPGNSYVDWISWNVYNQSGCAGGRISDQKFVSFENKMKIFYDFIQKRGPGLGMDITKPKMISEAGSARYPDNLALTAKWYSSIPSVLKKYPSIKAVGLWNSIDGSCNYRFDEVPQLVDAVKKAGLDQFVDANSGKAARKARAVAS